MEFCYLFDTTTNKAQAESKNIIRLWQVPAFCHMLMQFSIFSTSKN